MTTTTRPRTSAEPVLSADSVGYSADSHVLEPGILWTKYIEPAFRDRVPHVEYEKREADGTIAKGKFMVCEGINSDPAALFAAADCR